MILEEHKRVDGRSLMEIRELSAEVSLLPRTHGSALFQRGQTQVLTNVTLGPLGEGQKLDGVDMEEENAICTIITSRPIQLVKQDLQEVPAAVRLAMVPLLKEPLNL